MKAESFYQTTIMAVLGHPPETKQFHNGGTVTSFSLTTSEHWKDKTTNERKEATEWHRIKTNGPNTKKGYKT